jgi:hypothetical protein
MISNKNNTSTIMRILTNKGLSYYESLSREREISKINWEIFIIGFRKQFDSSFIKQCIINWKKSMSCKQILIHDTKKYRSYTKTLFEIAHFNNGNQLSTSLQLYLKKKFII